jgi:hypothetical protein
MSFLSRVVTRRRLFLVFVRVIVQAVVSWSSPTGLDAFEATCLHAADGTRGQPARVQPTPRDERDLIGPGSGLAWVRHERPHHRSN